MNVLQAFIYLLPFYLVLCIIPSILFEFYRKNYFKRINKMSISQVLNIKNRYLKTLIDSTEEEIIFRYFPYAYFGLCGLVPFSVVWSYLHIPNRETEKNLKIACFLMYLSFGVFFIYACLVNIFMPVIYHIMHNYLCDLLEKIENIKKERKLKKSKFVSLNNNNKNIKNHLGKYFIKDNYKIDYSELEKVFSNFSYGKQEI